MPSKDPKSLACGASNVCAMIESPLLMLVSSSRQGLLARIDPQTEAPPFRLLRHSPLLESRLHCTERHNRLQRLLHPVQATAKLPVLCRSNCVQVLLRSDRTWGHTHPGKCFSDLPEMLCALYLRYFRSFQSARQGLPSARISTNVVLKMMDWIEIHSPKCYITADKRLLLSDALEYLACDAGRSCKEHGSLESLIATNKQVRSRAFVLLTSSAAINRMRPHLPIISCL